MSNANSTFRVEYAKSDRSKCKSCWSTINKDTFRFAIMTYSSKFDGKVPNWYHTDCFFKKVKLIDLKIIKGFDDLRWEDQDTIRKLTQENSTILSNENDPNETFSVQYAKSNRSACHGCEELIKKDTLRLSRKNFTSKRARRYGPTDEWYHVDCFNETKKDLGFFGLAESFSGFADLTEEDQMELKEKFGTSSKSKRKRKGVEMNNESTEAKQSKTEDVTEETLNEQEEKRHRKEQSELLWTYKDSLRKDVPNGVLKELLEFNGQKAVFGESNLIEAVTDCMAFGALEPCPECNGSLVFNYTNYRCTGNITEWTKCSYSTQIPKRKSFEIPVKTKDNYDIFKNYTYTKRDRIIAQIIKKSKSMNQIILETKELDYDSKLPLNGYSVAVIGRLSKRLGIIQKQIEELGGTMATTIDATVDVIISTLSEVQKGGQRIQDAQAFEIHIVPEQFLNDILTDRPSIVMEKLKLSTWGILPHIRKQKAREEKKIKRKSSGTYKSNSRAKNFTPEKVTMKLKDGAAVDPDSGLAETCHVLKDNETSGIYTAVLGMGRIGTTFGSKKIDEYNNRSKAINAFYRIFFDKTGNEWINRGALKKLPNKLYPLEIDYGQHSDNEQIQKLLNDPDSKNVSHLPSSVQDLIRMIFNVGTMEQTLLSFDIDLRKMPLGKLSRNQLNTAYKVLTELQTLITSGSTNKNLIIDANNRFYTLIPHDFGLSKPKILDNIDLIQSKTQMIDNLLEIEIAYSMLQGSLGEKTQNPIDVHYKKLKCIIEPVDKDAEEFKRIEQYMINTHASTHNQYKLKLKDLFEVKREGEDDRFQKWKNVENHQLLWHGSRTTNFAGILSQGLRIAPPEAPMTGYMFGKGVYFADMASKSANYCCTKRETPEGLMLLCEVALGKMHECYKSTSLSAETLPKGTQSTKGCGQTIPDPKEYYNTDDGVLVPMGRGINANISHSSLLYNEYIVYDTNQIKLKYLLRIDFDYKD